jgi:glutamate racemase
MPIVGVEPGLKPAAAATRNGKVAVIATNVTIAGEKFLLLRDQITSASQAQFLLQGCPGLVDQIELGLVDAPATVAMLEGFIGPLLDQGADTLVLGCTHYPFVQNAIEAIILARGAEVVLVDTGEAVARRLASLLATADLLNPGLGVLPAQLDAFTTGTEIALSGAFSRLLGLTQTVSEVQIVSKIAIPAVSQQF